jgi:hypothetical protein
MKYALGNMLGGGFVGGLDPDAEGYIDAVVAAGGTVSGGQKSAINTFYKTGKANGWHSSLKRMYLPIWAAAAPNAIDMVGLTSGTFVGGVTHAAGYVQGNGTSGSLLLNANLPTMGVGHTNIAMGSLCYIAPTLFGRNLFSSFDNVSQMVDLLHVSAILINSRIGSFSGAADASLTPANAAAHRGVIIGSYDGTSRFIKILRSSGITTGTGLAAATGATPTSTPRFMTDSRNASGWSDAGYGAFYISTGMTTSNADSFITAVETLWEGTTNLVLP